MKDKLEEILNDIEYPVIDSVRRKPDELALRMNTHKLTLTVNYI